MSQELGADLEEKQEPREALAAARNIVTDEMIRTSLIVAAIEPGPVKRISFTGQNHTEEDKSQFFYTSPLMSDIVVVTLLNVINICPRMRWISLRIGARF